MSRVDIGLLLVVLLVVAVVWRGPKTLPQLGRMLSDGVRAARREARRHGGAGPGSGSSTS